MSVRKRRWTWEGWLIPRGRQFTSSTTGMPCLYSDTEDIEDINHEIKGKPVRVRVVITERRTEKWTLKTPPSA